MADDRSAQSNRPEPLRDYQFALQIQNIEVACFTACSNIGMRVNPIRYREGGARQNVRWLTGDVEYSEIVLRFGVTTSDAVWNWIQRNASGERDARNASVILFAPDHATEAVRYNLMQAWPCEWNGAVLDARGHDVAFETLKLVCEEIQIVHRQIGG